MQKYINQLIEDIQYAKANIQKPWIVPEGGYEFDEWLSEEEDKKQAPVRNVEDWSGIKKEQLPPEDRLTDEQVEALFKALDKLLSEFNCHFVVHFHVPFREQYKTMRAMWQQDHAWMAWHYNFFDLCEDGQEHGTCALGEDFCQCKALAEFTKDWDNSPWTEEDEAFWEEMEARRQRRKRDDWWGYDPDDFGEF
jgi:hypothetical protein